MVESSALSSSTSSRAVVRPLSRAAERPCARPSCPAPARATLHFAYATREATLGRLSDAADPQGYDLCVAHASRTDPPRGWALRDERPAEDRVAADVPPPPRDLGSEATVAVLAAALRAVPDAPTATPSPAPDAQVELPASHVEPPVAPSDAAASVPLVAPARTSSPAAPARQPRPVPAAGDRRPRATGAPATDW